MTLIKLGKLPQRTLVKLSINLAPALSDDLAAYATMYREAYGQEDGVADLIPAILSAFLESDREFVRRRKLTS